jgi:hypothetical protein
MKSIFLVFLFVSVLSNCLFAQQFSIKAGTGYPFVYQTSEINYYGNKLDHESNPVFIFSLRINWHLVGNLHIAWEPGVIEKSGKITGNAIGYDAQYNEIFRIYTYTLWNIENSVLLNYDLFKIKDYTINIYLGPGISWNVSDKDGFGISESSVAYYYNNYNYLDYEDPYLNNTGPYLAAGTNMYYKRFQFDLRYIKEYSGLGVSTLGTHKSYMFCFLIGYEM